MSITLTPPVQLTSYMGRRSVVLPEPHVGRCLAGLKPPTCLCACLCVCLCVLYVVHSTCSQLSNVYVTPGYHVAASLRITGNTPSHLCKRAVSHLEFAIAWYVGMDRDGALENNARPHSAAFLHPFMPYSLLQESTPPHLVNTATHTQVVSEERIAINRPPRQAITNFTLKQISPSCTHALYELALVTGRTHQIRVHLADAGTLLTHASISSLRCC